jgi:hypothetical protein
MQDVVNEMNKMNRAPSHLLFVDLKGELALQVTGCMRTLGVGFHPQTLLKIK